MNNFFSAKRVLVTGGAGFIGSHLVEELIKRGASVRVTDSLQHGKLENLASCFDKIEFVKANLLSLEECLKVCKDIDIVFNLAAKVAGVSYNVQHSAEMFWVNSMINLNMLEAARRKNVERFLVVSSVCVYPRYPRIPTPETEGFKDDPEPANLGYGWAKRVAELQARLYFEEYGMKIGIVRPANTYGPRDYFDLEEGHVIPALIRKILSGSDMIIVWGTGEQSRTFIYVTDVVEGMLLAMEKYPKPDPINIASDEEIKIKDLVFLIAGLARRKNIKVIFDPNKPMGQPRRALDTTKAKKLLGFKPKVPLEEGLKRTIQWYRQHAKI